MLSFYGQFVGGGQSRGDCNCDGRVDLDDLEPERLGGARHRRATFDGVPERP